MFRLPLPGFLLIHKKMSNNNQSLQNIFDMNEYQREINRQRNQGIEPQFNKKPRMLTHEEVNTIGRAHRRWKRGTRKLRYKNKANVRLFQHMNEAGRGKKGENHTLSNRSKRNILPISKLNIRRNNLKVPLMWEHYHSSESNEPRNHRPIEARLHERERTRRLLKHLHNTGKLFI